MKINYAWKMLARHLNDRRGLVEQRKIFSSWQAKLLSRIRIRIFFVKFLEYRGAKLLGFESWKEAKRQTENVLKVR